MLIGIDVGGTYTDAVLVSEGRILAHTKTPTDHRDLLAGILQALDQVLAGKDVQEIKRVALSTTLVTNAIIERKTEPVGLFVIPGPGLNIIGLTPVEPVLLSGYTDHRGRIKAKVDVVQIQEACKRFSNCRVFAVSGKFAVRNPEQENLAVAEVRQSTGVMHISSGSRISGTLNFVRRTNSAYYNAAVWKRFGIFAAAVNAAVEERGLSAPVYILKADGGTLPLPAAKEQPVEAIFTGPAASVLGILALDPPSEPAVSIDIGGTTTDIALWRGGLPLFAQRGATVDVYPTAVRAFWLKSVGLGGDSWARLEDGELKLGPQRQGPAMSLGGPVPTLTDALIVAGYGGIGNRSLAVEAMRQLSAAESVEITAAKVVDLATQTLVRAIGTMIDAELAEPVYRVEEIVRAERFQPELLIGVGGAAASLAPLVAGALSIPVRIPPFAMVANAVGAAVARPTVDITLRADTSQGSYTVAELGLTRALSGKKLSTTEARSLAEKHLAERAETAGITMTEVESIYEESFNVIRGFSTTGQIVTLRMQLKPGILMKVTEGGDGA